MKKTSYLALALVMAIFLAQTVSAATWTPNPGHVADLNVNPGNIPMYGYVGPELTDIDDPDPDDPDVNPFFLNVSVPVKFLWAAFEPGSPSPSVPVEAPDYKIINHSTSKYEVFVIGFTEKDNLLDPALGYVELNLTSTGLATDFDQLLETDVSTSAPYSLGIIDEKDGAEDVWTFTITGDYYIADEWPEDVQLPIYEIVFSFEAK